MVFGRRFPVAGLFAASYCSSAIASLLLVGFVDQKRQKLLREDNEYDDDETAPPDQMRAHKKKNGALITISNNSSGGGGAGAGGGGEVITLVGKRDIGSGTNSDNWQQIRRAREAVKRQMAISGAPGVSVGVSRNGHLLWAEGFGFADVETGARCTPDSVMRIASISKPITAAIAGRLMERGKLDIDKPIHDYIPVKTFPKKSFDGKEVDITTRQLLSHTSGIRHYPKRDENAPDSEAQAEFMSNQRYKSVPEALTMFKEDPLLCAPGTQFHYTTHGYTLASAVLEAVSGEQFKQLVTQLFWRLDMANTHLEVYAQEPVVANRTRYYKRSARHRLENVREVDNSYKIAGGGILSCVGDLLKFANAVLYSYQFAQTTTAYQKRHQQKRPKNPPPLLKPETVRQLWSRNSSQFVDGKKRGEYGLGWALAAPNWWDSAAEHLSMEFDEVNEGKKEGKEIVGNARATGGADLAPFEKRKYWYHTGGAVGTSSALLIKPAADAIGGAISSSDYYDDQQQLPPPPRGVCVAILVNCQDCPCLGLAAELADIFDNDNDEE